MRKKVSRRSLLLACALGPLGHRLPALAQRPHNVRRIGFLSFGSRQTAIETGRRQVFLDAMRARGHSLGKDFVLEERYAGGNSEHLRRGVLELAKLRVDVIVTTGTPAMHEARQASDTIPIVVALTGADPVATGYAATLARPGGNVTGLYVSESELIPKLLELLLAVLPKLSRVAIMQNPLNRAHETQLKTASTVADGAGIQVVRVSARTSDGIEQGFALIARERAEALLVLGDGFFIQQAKQIADLALTLRLPSIAVAREYVVAGGMMSYGENIIENYRLAADYVDRILRGTKPGDLPFRRSSELDLTINRATFKALGISVPHELALRAKEV